ncbi:DNA cytosine methyltransferase [Marinobacter sp. G11]|uniref:DNA cytosine methyltransferase n=1 Tax=Marinobacter sp. G11 TaxID=2903522 RepID=UPI001E4577BA|nr:DNA cytosine methyltransferase [Marinobacter sp. G11]MCE0761018.1 DNA cytosine methyltransferase [Marinobacter sp. G11]
MATIINTKLGEHRGKKRIWLEGQKLIREGYRPGMKYDLEIKDSQVLLHVKDTGRFTVSKRERNGRVLPIIDLTAQELAEIFDGVEMLRVAIKNGKIVVSAHHQHQKVKERVERLANKLKSGEPLSVCSLFMGGGVLDKALHKGLWNAGISSKVAVAVELEGKYLDSSLRNNPELWDDNSMVIESPIQAVNMSRNPPQVDLVVGGIPCTGASKSGRSKNKLEFAESHEAAGAMFFYFLQFVEVLNPSLVVIENVPEYQNTASMAVIRSVLGSLGYDLQERILDGNEFGVLEKRKRLCAIAVSKGIEGFDLENVLPVRKKEAQLKDILEPVAHDSDRWKSFDYLADKEKRDKAAGKGFSRQLLTGEESFCGTIGRDYAKCRSTEPFIVNPENPALSRILTPVEHSRVKGIPESVIEGLSDTVAHQILGQSVIFPAFEAVAKELGDSLWRWQGLKPALVEVVDIEQPFIGGDDFHWASAVVDGEGYIELTPAAKVVNMPISFDTKDSHIAFYDPEGKEVSAASEPCYYVPAAVAGDGRIKVDAGLIH